MLSIYLDLIGSRTDILRICKDVIQGTIYSAYALSATPAELYPDVGLGAALNCKPRLGKLI